MKHPFHKTMKGKFIIIISLLILILSIGITTLCYFMFYKNLESNMIHTTETNLSFLSESINYDLDQISSFILGCQTNTEVVRFLMTDRSSEKYNHITVQAADQLNANYLSNNSHANMRRVVICGFERKDFLQLLSTSDASYDWPMPEKIQSLPYFEDSLKAGSMDNYPIRLVDSYFSMAINRPVVPIIRPIEDPYSSNYIGYIYVEISRSLFSKELFKYSVQEKSPVFLTIGKDTYKIENDEFVLDESQYEREDYDDKDLSKNSSTIMRIKKGSGSSLVITKPLDWPGCYISQPLSQEAFKQQLYRYFLIIGAVVIIILILGIVLMLIFYRIFTRPVLLLDKRMAEIAKGNFEPDRTIEWNNEIGDISRNVNQLAIDVGQLMEKRISDEKEKKDYEYKMLQSQINPHFLYNTLNSIKWMASVQHAPGIAEMTTALSRLLRSIAKGTRTIVSIEDELELLNDYFTIQKYRYGGSITMECIIDHPDIKRCEILRFTLQPIVENSIFHGIEPKDNEGHIAIHAFYNAEDDVQIDITDDGIGMTEQTIKNILLKDEAGSDKFFRDLGISSVHKRIQYQFGDEYGLNIKSEPGVFTTMSILLPNINKGAF